jgi:hypothetical protein
MRPVDFRPSPAAPRLATDDVAPKVTPEPPVKAKAPEDRWDSGPAIRIRNPRHFDPANEKGWVAKEVEEVKAGPGFKFLIPNPDDVRIEDRRTTYSRNNVGTGVTAVPGGELKVTDIHNPNSLTGDWDPYEFMPHFIFDKDEDNFPVSPSFDGDDTLSNNTSPTDPNKQGPYFDGVIGGKQALNGAFTVTQKGEYIVQTFNFYSAKDKGGGAWHPNDYHTAQVYLKPGAGGNLEPEYLYTSFHHGGILTPYGQLKKDENGRPMVEVKRGTHAIRPIGTRGTVPEGGLEILGDGNVSKEGKKLNARLGFDAFQSNIQGARKLEAGTPAFNARRKVMEWGDVPLRPMDPEEFPTQFLHEVFPHFYRG